MSEKQQLIRVSNYTNPGGTLFRVRSTKPFRTARILSLHTTVAIPTGPQFRCIPCCYSAATLWNDDASVVEFFLEAARAARVHTSPISYN